MKKQIPAFPRGIYAKVKANPEYELCMPSYNFRANNRYDTRTFIIIIIIIIITMTIIALGFLVVLIVRVIIRIWFLEIFWICN